MTVVGAQYYRPPNPPREDWSRDLRLMREAGFTTVKFWACWSWMEPRPGEIDFADLDELLDLAHEHGLGVVINTILEDAPYWLEEDHPESRYRDAEDRPVHLTAAMNTPGGGWPGLCFHNSAVWAAAERFLGALVERYDAHPALEVWDVWNEPHLEPASYFPDRIFCYCDASLERFGSWLRERYGTVDALNASWERRYSEWSQVAPPRIFESVPDMIDWREFWFGELRSWLDARVAAVRSRAEDGRTVMTHVALSGFTGQLATHTLDEFTLTGGVDVFGTSSFPTWLMADDHAEHLFNLETARDAASPTPFWQAELQGGRGRRDGVRSTPQPHPDVTALWMWNALATGATGIMFWQWRPELLGPESPGYGLTAADGSPTARVAAASALAAVATRPELSGRVPVAGSVGLLVSRRAALHAFATDRTMDLVRDASLGGYRLLLDADLPVTVVHEDQLASGGVPPFIRSLYWPMPAVSDDRIERALVDFVERGGTLVAEASPGEYGPTGRRRTRVPAGELAALFGAHEIETTVTEPESVPVGAGALEFGWHRSLLLVDEATVVATFVDGLPAVTRARRGHGEALLLGGVVSAGSAAASSPGTVTALRDLLSAGASGWSTPTAGLVSRESVTADGRILRVLVNWTQSDAEFRAPGSWLVIAEGGAESIGDDVIVVPARRGRLVMER